MAPNVEVPDSDEPSAEGRPAATPGPPPPADVSPRGRALVPLALGRALENRRKKGLLPAVIALPVPAEGAPVAFPAVPGARLRGTTPVPAVLAAALLPTARPEADEGASGLDGRPSVECFGALRKVPPEDVDGRSPPPPSAPPPLRRVPPINRCCRPPLLVSAPPPPPPLWLLVVDRERLTPMSSPTTPVPLIAAVGTALGERRIFAAMEKRFPAPTSCDA